MRRVKIAKLDGGGKSQARYLPTRWTDSFREQCCRFCNDSGTRRSPNAGSSTGTLGPWWHGGAEDIAEGYSWVVDLDLEKFFDRVNHNKLMGQIAKRSRSKRLRKRSIFNAGVMEGGLVSPSVEGSHFAPVETSCSTNSTRELERRGHRYCRYADDGNMLALAQ